MTKDAVVMVSQYIAHIQTITSRATDLMEAAVLNLGKVEAGEPFNMIAENAKLEGTVRTFDAKTRDIVETEMKRYAERTAAMYGGTVKFKYHRLLDSVINETQSAQLVQSIARNSFGEDSVGDFPPTMGGKDFGEYTNYINSAFATVGTRNISKGSDYPHHHACFNVVEESLKVNAELYGQYALSYIYIKMNFN